MAEILQKNSIFISIMTVISAIAVVILHSNVSFWTSSVYGPFWKYSNIIESVFYFAVPAFFMITGATLIDYRERYSTKEFFKKRFFKTVIPFIFWSLFSLFWAYRKVFGAMIAGEPNSGLNWKFAEILNGLINTKFRDIYWFFIPLFCVYLTMPLLSAVEKEKRVRIFSYIVLISLPINVVIPFVLNVLKRYTEINIGWSYYAILVAYNYMFYVLVGYVLYNKPLKLWLRLLIYALAIIGLLTHIIGTYYETKAMGKVVSFYKGYYNLPCVLYSVGIFLFVKKATERIKSERAFKVFGFLQSFTFPIYLIHRYFLDVFEELIVGWKIDKASFLYVGCATVAALLLSCLLTFVLRKIPIVRKIVP